MPPARARDGWPTPGELQLRHKLTDVPRTLAERTGRPAPAGAYAKLWRAIADGRLTAERQGQGWWVRDEAMPHAAALLGMVAAETDEVAA